MHEKRLRREYKNYTRITTIAISQALPPLPCRSPGRCRGVRSRRPKYSSTITSPSAAATGVGHGGGGPLVPKVLGVEVAAILFEGATGAASRKMIIGSGRDGDPWPSSGYICPRSSGGGRIAGSGGIPRAEEPRLGLPS
jgi:hypothetical protein